MRLIIITSLILLGTLNSTGQSGFDKILGGSSDESIYSVINTSDGGHLATGNTNSSGAGNYDIFLVKYDSLWNLTWSKTYGGTSNEMLQSIIIEHSNGGYVIAGHTESFGASGRDGLIIYVDSNGNIVWNKRYSVASNETFRSMMEMSNGDILLGGSANLIFGGSDLLILRLDMNGNSKFRRVYGGADNEHLERVKELPDGNILMVGNTMSFGSNDKSFFLAKADTAGTVLWQKYFDGTGLDALFDVEVLPNGDFIGVGISDSWGAGGRDACVMKFDSNGNLLWVKVYGGNVDDEFKDITVLPSGNYILYGYTASFGAGGNDLMLLKTDSDGNMFWAKTYGDTGDESLNEGDHTLTYNGINNLLLGARSSSFGTSLEGLILSTDTTASLFCNDITDSLNLAIPVPQVANTALSMTNTGTYSNPAVLSANFPLTESFGCICDPGFDNPYFEADTTNGLSVSFTSTSIESAFDFTWDFGDGQFSNLDEPTHSYNNFGTYWACLNITNQCGFDTTICDSITVMPISTESINDFNNTIGLSLFPNPANDHFQVFTKENLEMTICSLSGAIIQHNKLYIGEQTIDISQLAAGIYMLRFTNEFGELNKKLTIVR